MNNKIIQILIPVIAVIVIFESIMLVTNLEKSTTNQNQVTPTVTEVPKINSFDISFLADEPTMKIGKKYKVSVIVNPRENSSLNALDLYVKYNPELMTVSSPTGLKTLGTPILLKVSDKKDVVAMSYLFEDKEGFSFTKDVQQTLLTFTVTPKTEGTASLEISSGNDDGSSVTMLVDKTTSQALNFTSNKLDIVFEK